MKKVYVIALFMALITGLAAYLFITDLQNSVQQTEIQTAPVAIALTNIPENTVITEDMFEIRLLPAVAVSPGVARSEAEVLGRIVTYPIEAGEQINPQRLRKPGQAQGVKLSYELLEGERAYTLKVDEISGVAGYVRVGDFVDIFTTRSFEVEGKNGEEPKNETETIYLLENIRVLMIADKATNMAGTEIAAYQSVTLCLTPEEVLVLGEAVNLGMSIRLTLRPVPLQTGEATESTDSADSAASGGNVNG